MTKITVNEFRTDPDRALAMIEAGVKVEITRGGQAFAEIRPVTDAVDPEERGATLARLRTALEMGIPFGRRFTYEERTS